MKKTVDSKGGLAKFLVFLLIVTMAILTPISNIAVLAEPVSTESEESNPASEGTPDAEIVDSKSGQEETGTQAETPAAGLETSSEDQSVTPEGSAADPTAGKDKQEPQEPFDSENKEQELSAASAKNTQPNSADLFTYNGNTITGLTEEGKTYFVEGSIELYIPSEINGNNIQVIGENAFKDEGISGALIIPSYITKIENNAFCNNHLIRVEFQGDKIDLDRWVFSDNDIEKVDFGKVLINGWIWGYSGHRQDGVISAGTFQNNRITELDIPSNHWAIGGYAFAKNRLEALIIPSTIKNIYHDGFYNNSTLKTLKFQTDDHGNGVEQIDRSAFQNCDITGTLVFPDNFNEMGGFSFSNNKIESVVFSNKKPIILGYFAFSKNPLLESVSIPECKPNGYTLLNKNEQQATEPGAFSTGVLKNVQYMDNSHEAIAKGTFRNNFLKAVNIPNTIKYLSKVYKEGDVNPIEPFSENSGWYDGDVAKRVALYRVKDVNAKIPEYEMDNSLADGESYVINPLLIEFHFFDKNGITPLQIGKQPKLIEMVSKRTGRDLDLKVTKSKSDWTDFENFKLGDELSIKVPNGFSIEGKKDDYSISLDPKTNQSITDVFYGNGYNVGYKKLVIEVKLTEELPEIPSTPTPKPNNPNPIIQPIIETPVETTAIEDTIVPLADKELEDERIVLEDGETEERIEEEQIPLSDIPKTSERFGFATNYLPSMALVLISVLFLTLSFTKKAEKRD